jgi:arylsulfatase
MLGCVVLAVMSLVSAGALGQATRPNIVVILADDLGYSDLSCYGSEIPTPNIDRLAEQGVRFTDFHNAVRCCPSRAALMTGRYQHQVGVGAMIDKYATWIREAANRPSYQDRLSPDSPTMAELLRKGGYRTMMCGKWHLGDRPEEWPAARGFDRSFVLIPGAMNYFGGESKGPRSPMALDDKPFTPPHDGFFATDAFTDRALEFMRESKEKQKDQPFFLYMAYNAPHWPLQAKPDDIAKHRGKYDAGWQRTREARLTRMKELKIVDASQQMAPMDRGKTQPWNELNDEQRKEWALRMEIYAAQVTNLDDNIGRLMGELSSLGVAEDTLVVFVSDNGGAPEDPHRGPAETLGTRETFWGYARPWATVSNTPWRHHKVTAYEGGSSTPFVAHWPKGIPASANGTLVREPAHLIDLMPTVLELAGQTYPTSDTARPEGQSIVNMIKGQPGAKDRTLFWEHEGNRAIRKGKWKLVMLANAPGWELYDMEADRIEGNDLAAKHPEIVKDLSAEYDRWAERCGVVPWSEIEPKRPAPASATAPARGRNRKSE